jgi:hypothetical protein
LARKSPIGIGEETEIPVFLNDLKMYVFPEFTLDPFTEILCIQVSVASAIDIFILQWLIGGNQIYLDIPGMGAFL